MAKKKKSILQSRFYRVYFILVILALIGIAVGTIWLNGQLKDYQTKLDNQQAQLESDALKVAALFENGDYDYIYDFDRSAEQMESVGRDFYVQSMHEIADGKQVTWSESYSTDNEHVYAVRLDGEKFASFTLVPDGSVNENGCPVWRLGSITTYVELADEPVEEDLPEEGEDISDTGEETDEASLDEASIEEASIEEPVDQGIEYRITAPTESVVTVDGRQLTMDDAVTRDIATASAGLLPDGVPSPTLTEYAVFCEDEPEITVIDKFGNAQELTRESETVFACGLPEYTELKQYESGIIGIATKLAKFTSEDLTQKKMLTYCAKNSPARSNVKIFDNSWAAAHSKTEVLNATTSDYYLYSDKCFSCRVSFDYLIHYRKAGNQTYPTTYTLYFVREGKDVKLYNFTLY